MSLEILSIRYTIIQHLVREWLSGILAQEKLELQHFHKLQGDNS
jgi:hypothetical protein